MSTPNTPVEVLAECARRGILLTPTPEGRLRYEDPAGALTPELLAALSRHKPVLLQILWRLNAMRAHGVDRTDRRPDRPPLPVAVWPRPPVGPGHCFSCGDPLEHPAAYGRCDACALAAEVFWATRAVPPGHRATLACLERAARGRATVEVVTPGGHTVPVPVEALKWIIAIQDRGLSLRERDGALQLEPAAAVRPEDRAALAQWGREVIRPIRALDAPNPRA